MFFYFIPLCISIQNKCPPLDILKTFVTTLSNQDKKVAFVRVDEYRELARYYEFMETCQNMNIIVQNKGGYTFSINGKNEIPKKTLDNITRALILKVRHKK